MPKECMIVWTIVLKDDREETTTTEELIQAEKKERKRKERKKKRERKKDKSRKERKRMRNCAETLHVCAKAKAIADRQAMEHEYYYEEYKGYFEDECEYDDEQLAYYYQDYIEDRKRDIRKQLIRRNQPARTARHSRWGKEMQLRRKQQEEQETEVQIIIYETEQQQEQKKKDDKKRKEITKPNHITEWIQEWLAMITQLLDGTGGHAEPPSKMT
jgi:hypothetical protein